MKKLLMSICCFIILAGIMGCNNKTDVSEDKKGDTVEDNNSAEDSDADINNLFSDIDEIESIKTMRIDIQYTLDTSEQIDELMRRLEDIKFTEYHTEEPNDEAVPEGGEVTGSRTNGITLVFYYKDGSRKRLEFSSTEAGEFVKYAEVTYDPYEEKTRMYTTDEQVWSDLLVIMEKGKMEDLNQN